MSNLNSTDAQLGFQAFGRRWWLLVVFGVVTLGFGIVLTFKPSNSVHTIAVIFGIWLFILGVIRLVQAISATGERFGFILVGLGSILVAILLLHHTTTTIAVVGFIVGIFWTISGVTELVYGFSANDGRISWAVVALGLVATIVGVLCLVYPNLSLSIICVIVGIGLILYGGLEIVAGFGLRRPATPDPVR